MNNMAVIVERTMFFVACCLYPFLSISSDCSFTVHNHVLVGQHITKLTNIDWFHCLQACSMDDRCHSYNFCFSGTGSDVGVCELNECLIRHQNSLVYSTHCVFQQLSKPRQEMIVCYSDHNHHHKAMWVKATKQEVCVHTSRNAELYSPLTGGILSVRLIHTRGTITCDKNARSCGAMWGCACVQRQQTDRRLDIIITDHNSNIVFPDMKSPDDKLPSSNSTIWYTLPNQSNEQRTLTFPNLTTSLPVRNMDKFIIWYSSHLLDRGPSWANAKGLTCFKVEMLYYKINDNEPF